MLRFFFFCKRTVGGATSTKAWNRRTVEIDVNLDWVNDAIATILFVLNCISTERIVLLY